MLEKILQSCKYVADNSKSISINEIELDKLIKNIDNADMKHWLSSSPYGLLDLTVETIVNFLLVYESVCFSFWGDPKWKVNAGSEEADGSRALMYAILKYVKQTNSTDFSNMTQEEFSEVLKGNIEIPLFKERYENITNTSRIVNEKINGNFYKFIKNVTSDIELFDIIIKYFPCFKDERIYNGKRIYIYKLAQLLTSDILHIREIKENLKVDYSHLAGCADYKIPQKLRALGVLEYSKELANLIDSQTEIEKNSTLEIEIRANTLVVINMIKEKSNNNVTSIAINDYLYCKKLDDSLLKPYHLTRCINY